jgi:hypothetical protein
LRKRELRELSKIEHSETPTIRKERLVGLEGEECEIIAERLRKLKRISEPTPEPSLDCNFPAIFELRYGSLLRCSRVQLFDCFPDLYSVWRLRVCFL